MNTIKFIHNYYKIPYEDWIPNTKLTAQLLEVLIADRENLDNAFVDYDTSFCECISENKYKKGFYPLPLGKLIILLLLTTNSSGRHLWTTIRRWTSEKEAYYRGIRGKQVEIVIEPRG